MHTNNIPNNKQVFAPTTHIFASPQGAHIIIATTPAAWLHVSATLELYVNLV